MKIIPVIDLLGGQVVHAVKGRRAHYQPLESSLCSSCDAVEVADALLRHTNAQTLYIADLDALMGARPQTELIDIVQTKFPDIELWLDNGSFLQEHKQYAAIIPVIGSESLSSATWAELQSRPSKNWILSLDFFNGVLKGYAGIVEQAEYWPDRVIVMCLDQVGSLSGPDRPRLENIFRLAPAHCRIIAAGGIRHREDVLRLEKMGVAAILAASALHAGITL